jgi:hypothetical protein
MTTALPDFGAAGRKCFSRVEPANEINPSARPIGGVDGGVAVQTFLVEPYGNAKPSLVVIL